MGNLLACFGSPKKEKRKNPTHHRSPPPDQVCERYELLRPSPIRKQLSPPQTDVPSCAIAASASAADAVPELRSEQLSFSSPKKKVTFDLNVKTYEDAPACEDPSSPLNEDGHEQKVQFKEDGIPQKEEGPLGAYPLNHRYQNCSNCDDEDIGDDDYNEEEEESDGEEDKQEHDFEDDNVGIVDRGNQEEESYDSYFSLQMDKDWEIFKEISSSEKAKHVSPPDQKKQEIQTKQNPRDRRNYVHSVLNPVENLSKWKQVKAREIPIHHPKKENINLEAESKVPLSPEPCMKFQKPQISFDSSPSSNISVKREVSVDASLSSWLTSPETTPVRGSEVDSYSPCKSKSPTSLDDRPILGALTLDDIKQSRSPSPRKSPSRIPDEMPILGTVGSYWSHTNQEVNSRHSRSDSATKGIPNTTSKYREDKRVNWHSTPFEVRLERALNKGSAGQL